jgi:5'-nucleotidase
VGVTYQQALSGFLVDDLAGLVSQADYPEGGSGRITQL